MDGHSNEEIWGPVAHARCRSLVASLSISPLIAAQASGHGSTGSAKFGPIRLENQVFLVVSHSPGLFEAFQDIHLLPSRSTDGKYW